MTTSLDGALTLDPFPGFNPSFGVPLTLVTSTTDIVGSFSKVINNLPPSLRYELIYDPTMVILELFPVFNRFISFKEVAFTTVNQINLLLVNHMDRMVDPCRCNPCGYQFYVDPIGSVGRVKTKNEFTGFNFNTAGFVAGFDSLYKMGGIGLAFDYERQRGFGFHEFGFFNTNKFHVSGYGTIQPLPKLSFNAIVGGGWDNISLHRTTGLYFNQKAHSSTQGQVFDAFGEAEYRIDYLKWVNCIPLAGLQYIYYRLDQFKESGVAGFNFGLDRQYFKSLRTLLGLKFNSNFCVKGIKVVPEINIAWQRELQDYNRHVAVTSIDLSIPNTFFDLSRTGLDTILAGADVALSLDRFTIDAAYEFEGNERYLNHFFTLELAASF
jgi:outer membrane autotransporter protein